MTSAIRTVKDRHNPEASHIISSSRHQTTDHQQSPEQQQAVLLPHSDHTTMQHGSGVVHATAAAALPAATPAPGMPAAPAATVTGKSGATQSPSRLDAALAKQQYALVSIEGYLAWCIRWHLCGKFKQSAGSRHASASWSSRQHGVLSVQQQQQACVSAAWHWSMCSFGSYFIL